MEEKPAPSPTGEGQRKLTEQGREEKTGPQASKKFSADRNISLENRAVEGGVKKEQEKG